MEYEEAVSLTKQTELVRPDYLDERMEKARAISIDAKKKLLAAKQQARVEHQQEIQELKTSLYGF